jgi:serine protease Do
MSVGRKLNRLSVFFLVIGILIGIIITAELPLSRFGRATNPATEGRPLKVDVPLSDQPFVEVSKLVTPAVVNISTTRLVKGEEGSPLGPFFEDPFFRRFFGDELPQRRAPRQHKEQSLGSGVIVDPKGYIVTNNHVISKAEEIKVVLADRREFKGKLIGSDPKSDIAVVKIEGKDLPTVSWADSTKIKVGEYVLAVGNPFGLNQTVTMGIISAVGRANVGIADYEDFIQTDAAINPGNSGGALVNIRGELIGINTAIFSRSGGYMGIGFAVPSAMARTVMDSLIKKGKVVRGWLGISIQEVTPDLAKEFGLSDAKGVLVAEVLPKSPAERAGLKRGDVILALDGHLVENAGQVRNQVAALAVGEKIRVKVFRDKQEKEIEVRIGEQPKEVTEGEGDQEEEGGETSSALSGLEVRNLTSDIIAELGLPKNQKGVVVESVEPGSSPEEAGLRRGDVIVEINRKQTNSTREYERIVASLRKDRTVLLLVNRQGRSLFLTIGPSEGG